MTEPVEPGNVVRMAAVRNGVPDPDLRLWARSWIDGEAFDPDSVRSVVIVVERIDGMVSCVGQSRQPLDGIRLVGVLQHLIHRLLHGKGLGL